MFQWFLKSYQVDGVHFFYKSIQSEQGLPSRAGSELPASPHTLFCMDLSFSGTALSPAATPQTRLLGECTPFVSFVCMLRKQSAFAQFGTVSLFIPF